MGGTIRNLFLASVLLALCATGSIYFGQQHAASAAATAQQQANPLAQQFFADPGDGWVLAGGFLVLVALAFAFAGGMLWLQERKG